MGRFANHSQVQSGVRSGPISNVCIAPLLWQAGPTVGGRAMNSQSRKEDYLAEVARAEAEAKKAVQPDIRDGWLRIAAIYRELVRELDAR